MEETDSLYRFVFFIHLKRPFPEISRSSYYVYYWIGGFYLI